MKPKKGSLVTVGAVSILSLFWFSCMGPMLGPSGEPPPPPRKDVYIVVCKAKLYSEDTLRTIYSSHNNRCKAIFSPGEGQVIQKVDSLRWATDCDWAQLSMGYSNYSSELGCCDAGGCDFGISYFISIATVILPGEQAGRKIYCTHNRACKAVLTHWLKHVTQNGTIVTVYAIELTSPGDQTQRPHSYQNYSLILGCCDGAEK